MNSSKRTTMLIAGLAITTLISLGLVVAVLISGDDAATDTANGNAQRGQASETVSPQKEGTGLQAKAVSEADTYVYSTEQGNLFVNGIDTGYAKVDELKADTIYATVYDGDLYAFASHNYYQGDGEFSVLLNAVADDVTDEYAPFSELGFFYEVADTNAFTAKYTTGEVYGLNIGFETDKVLVSIEVDDYIAVVDFSSGTGEILYKSNGGINTIGDVSFPTNIDDANDDFAVVRVISCTQCDPEDVPYGFIDLNTGVLIEPSTDIESYANADIAANSSVVKLQSREIISLDPAEDDLSDEALAAKYGEYTNIGIGTIQVPTGEFFEVNINDYK